MLTRRQLLASLAAASACSRRDAPAPAASLPAVRVAKGPKDGPPPLGQTQILTWSLPERGADGEAVVILPADVGAHATRWPLVVALHGRGEAIKEPRDGAMGWARDYALPHVISRVSNPPLNEDDLQGFVDPERLVFYNERLAQHPFGGLVVLCPYLPETNLRSHADLTDHARYIADVLVPRARRELPVLATPEATGIDGVSMGGAIALRTGLTRTDTFGAVGALQPAIFDEQAEEWTELARAARAKRPGVPLRLTTSHDDYYNAVINRLSVAWRAAGVAHDFADIVGPHDYPFNRGPGAVEVLLWHDRVLRRTA